LQLFWKNEGCQKMTQQVARKPPAPMWIFLYNFLEFVQWWSSFPSIRPVIHPSRFLIPEEEDDGRGGGGGKTPVVLQFAKSYKLIFKN
jgi:hypothetical protein